VHELSLALEVCRIAEGQVGPEALPRVTEVGLLVGTDAGIEVENFRFCLEALLTAPPFRRARPALERCPGDELRVTYLEVDDGGP
jgi:Zn finger protein HypA/HybF involved in hydrogenase expression